MVYLIRFSSHCLISKVFLYTTIFRLNLDSWQITISVSLSHLLSKSTITILSNLSFRIITWLNGKKVKKTLRSNESIISTTSLTASYMHFNTYKIYIAYTHHMVLVDVLCINYHVKFIWTEDVAQCSLPCVWWGAGFDSQHPIPKNKTKQIKTKN